MEIGHLFSGSAIDSVDAQGRVALPGFVRRVIDRRSEACSVILGAHDTDPCLSGYDRSYAPILYAEVERRRLRDESLGALPQAHDARSRRLFGLAEEADFDRGGRLVLPEFLRRRGRIEDLALFVGTGGSFEIWNPHLAREAGDEALRDLAEYRLGETQLSAREERQ